MIIYNVTVNIELASSDSWMDYMKNEHIPDVMKTKCFVGYTFSKILTRQDDEEGLTFSIQYQCPDMPTLEKYQRDFAPALQAEHSQKFNGKFVAFRTLLEVID